MNFQEVALECIKNPELVSEFNRLTGCKLGIDTRAPIEIMIDEATGYHPDYDDMAKFVAFVFTCIWMRLGSGGEDTILRQEMPK